MFDLSIVIPIFNRISFLENLLFNIYHHQIYDGSLELVIVDDGGSQDVRTYLKNHYSSGRKNIKYVRLDRKSRLSWPGSAMANSYVFNIGAKVSDARNLLFCDAEMCFLNRNLLSEFSKPMASKTLRTARVFFINAYGTPLVKSLNHSFEEMCSFVKSYRIAYGENNYYHRRHPGLFCIQKSDYIDFGGADERFYGWWGVDTEMQRRFDKNHFRLETIQMDVAHLYHGSTGENELPNSFYRDLFNMTWLNHEFKLSLEENHPVFDPLFVKGDTIEQICP